jgi:SEC-C motif/Protein of unknown function (DUF2384)
VGKRARRRRREAGETRLNQKARRKLVTEAEARVDALLTRLLDPEVAAADVAPDLLDFWHGAAVNGDVAFLVCRQTSAARGRAIADAALDIDPEDLVALSFAATVAEFEGDDRRAVELWKGATRVIDDDEVKWSYAAALVGAGSTGAAFDVFDHVCREDPADDLWQALFRDALQVAHGRRTLTGKAPCPCNSGLRYARCCRENDHAALVRFSDRRMFDQLRARIDNYSLRPDLDDLGANARMNWFGDDAADIEGDDPKMRLFTEWSWTAPRPNDDDDDRDCILGCFADDPDVPDEWRKRADDWLAEGRYGLWQVRSPAPDPGIALLDILTGTRIYAAFPPEQITALAPWTVLLGNVVPVDGIWRSGGAFVPLSPSEADTVAREVQEMAAIVLEDLGAPKRAVADMLDELPDRAIAIEMESAPPFSEFMASVYDHVLFVALAQLVSDIEERRATPPRLVNMDHEPTLLITADIEVADADAAVARLRSNPDFKVADNGITWLGREMTPSEAETAMAEFRAWAAKEGATPMETNEPQRWVRAALERTNGGFRVDVNSRERLDLLMHTLEDMGARPVIASETKVDPSQDFALPGAAQPDGGGGMAPEARAAWQRTWVDDPVPALDGLTPREAAKSDEGRVLLEALLRELEHRAAALNRARGRSDIDAEALRIELGMVHGPH